MKIPLLSLPLDTFLTLESTILCFVNDLESIEPHKKIMLALDFIEGLRDSTNIIISKD